MSNNLYYCSFIITFLFFAVFEETKSEAAHLKSLSRFCFKAPKMRNLKSQFHSRLCTFLSNFGTNVQSEARGKGLATFNKTTFASQRRFLTTCLQRKVIPNGFSLKFNSSSSKGILQSCSFNLMRNALKDVTWKIQEHSKNLKASTQNLQVWCTHSKFAQISHFIHTCNYELYFKLDEIKCNKLKDLLPKLDEKD